MLEPETQELLEASLVQAADAEGPAEAIGDRPTAEPDLKAGLTAREGRLGELEDAVSQLRAHLEEEFLARRALHEGLQEAVGKYREAALVRARGLGEQLRSQMEARAQSSGRGRTPPGGTAALRPRPSPPSHPPGEDCLGPPAWAVEV